MGIRAKNLIAYGIIGSMLWLTVTTDTLAELSIEETRKLLQESLTISEIDREVQRLSEEEARVGIRIEETGKAVIQQEERVKLTREHAGKVLRSYYTGDRDGMWLLLLNADNFSDALIIFQYLLTIVESDQRLLDKYLASYRELKDLNMQLENIRTDLKLLKAQFLAQRVRLVGLQQQLDEKLAHVDNKEQLLVQMDELSQAWRKDGLPLFRQFLEAMSDAMLVLHEYIKTNDNSVEVNGNKYTFRIKDEQLNPFLRSKNKLFEQFVYTITNEHISIKGQKDDLEIMIKGHYVIEDDPENALRFTLDELIYNGFTLPDTTRNEMQQQFSMTFYPKRFAEALKATDVKHNQGELAIELEFSP